MARYHFRDVEDQRAERAYEPRRSEFPEPEPDYRPPRDEITFDRHWYDEPAR